MKKLFILLLSLMLLFALVSCGGSEDNPPAPECTEHADNNADGKCDTCGIAMKAPECTEHIDADGDGKCDVCGDATEATGIQIPLISSGEAKFRFVVANTLSGSARMEIALLTESLSEFGIETEVVFESTPSENICEILVGDVTSRGKKYEFDKYSLGKKGYIIKGIDNKIIINAGSEELMGEVIGIFASEILGITGGIDRLRDVTFTSSSDLIKIQDDYKITSLTVGGKSLVGKNIAVDKRNTLHLSASNYLQDIIYTYTGIYLPIVALEDTEESSIVIRRTPDDGEFGFNVYTDGDTLKIDCAFDKRIQEGVTAFMEDIIINREGIVNIDSSFRFSKDIRTVRYEDFGAKGDGRTDDAEAIRKTHEYANGGGYTVVATPGAKYLIKSPEKPITIKTNVIWTGCEIIIDDRGINLNSAQNVDVFKIASDYEQFTLVGDEARALFEDGKIDKDNFTKVNWKYGFSAIIIPKNENTKQYIRLPDANTGGAQQELVLIDEFGNVSKNTPCLFDFTDITSVTVIRVDDTPITIEGGIITTIANDTPCYKPSADNMYSSSMYIKRGITVLRSGTTFKNVEHYVTGELSGEDEHHNGPSYSGFYFVEFADGVSFINCVFTDHKYYGLAGTYDFQVYFSNETLFKDCTQSNFYLEDGKTPRLHNGGWGLMGSNFCKNLTYDGCTIARLDAHAGLYNGKVINSTVCVVEIIGGGDMLIENTKFVPTRNIIVDLRTDYGATWRGNITIRNCEVLRNFKPEDTCVFAASWYNFDFGYTCYMPNIVIDGLKFDRVIGDVQIFNSPVNKTENMNGPTLSSGEPNKNQYQPPKSIKVLNNEEGYSYKLYDIPFFKDVSLEGVTRG